MKKLLVTLVVLMLAMPIYALSQQQAADPAAAPAQPATEKPKEFVVYADKNNRLNHYIPSGWMGDYGDIKLHDASMDNPHSGATCMQFVYSAKKAQGQG